MRRLSVAIMLCFAAAAQAAPAPQQELSQTLKNLQESKESEAALKAKLEKTQSELDALQKRSANLAEKLQSSEQRVSAQEKETGTMSAELAAKQKDFEGRKADYAHTVLSLMRMQSLPPTALFTDPDNIHQLMRSASVLEKTNQAIAVKALKLREDMTALSKLKTHASASALRTRAEQEKLGREKANLEKELTARKALEAQLSEDHAKAEEKVAKLSQASKSLQDLISKLEENARTSAPSKSRASKVASLQEFSGSKGSLRAPVAGEVIHRFGERKNANETYRGMVFRARAGATVVSPYDGEVVFTGPFRDYGRMVLIKHKNGYISLIAGLGNVSASLNQTAIKGEPIGTMPDADAPEAYVELRDKQAKPIDPGNWFANVSSKLAQQ